MSDLPDIQDGLRYWSEQAADVDSVLGGYGLGTLPRIDALGSRKFLMSLRPDLCSVPSAIRRLDTPTKSERVTALDVGCGVGRTSRDVLLHLVDEVVLAEPVPKFIAAAKEDCHSWKGIADGSKAATFVQVTLQDLEPSDVTRNTTILGHAGKAQMELCNCRFDIVWCQWCLGHLSDPELIAFFLRARKSLNSSERSLIVVKENLCRDAEDGSPRQVFDTQDSSLTRSNAAWLKLFADSGLSLIKQKVQAGFPSELYVVKMYALR